MKITFLLALMLAFFAVNSVGGAKLLTSDPLTGLPLIPATDSGMGLGNGPSPMPTSQVCKSKMEGEFYSLFKIKVDATVAWYAAHLTGFKKIQGYGSGRSQTLFYNSDRTIVIAITGERGAEGENTNAYSVAYEKYQPGLSEKTINSVVSGGVTCP